MQVSSSTFRGDNRLPRKVSGLVHNTVNGVDVYDEWSGHYDPKHRLPSMRAPNMAPNGKVDSQWERKKNEAINLSAYIQDQPLAKHFPAMSEGAQGTPEEKRVTNCYALASGFSVVNTPNAAPDQIYSRLRLQPGYLSGDNSIAEGQSSFTCDDLVRLTMMDCNQDDPNKCIIDYELGQPGKPFRRRDKMPPKGYIPMGLYVDSSGNLRDYHYALQTKQGWIVHKPGSQRILNVDAKGFYETDLTRFDLNFQKDPNSEESGYNYKFCNIIYRRIDEDDKRDKRFNKFAEERGQQLKYSPARLYENEKVWESQK